MKIFEFKNSSIYVCIKKKDYLDSNNKEYIKDSISYTGIRNVRLIDGNSIEAHIVSFIASVNQNEIDAIYFITTDKEDENLIDITGPQSYERIE